jgi:nucleotide-binding universal stress UspA family protein
MGPDIQKILYATDLSQNAAYAFRYALYLAEKLNAKLIILHVIEKMSPDAQITLMTYLDKKDREKLLKEGLDHVIERIQKRLEIFCEKQLQDDQQVKDTIKSIKVCEGYPAEEILKTTEELNCDAIIMGAHEKGITHTFLGSVAKSVLRRSRHPTFIVPLPRGEIDVSLHV